MFKEIDIPVVGVGSYTEGDTLDYSGDCCEWVICIGFKGVKKCRSEVKFRVFRDRRAVGAASCLMTENEKFVRINFFASGGSSIDLEVTNHDDCTSMIITYQSISPVHN